MSILLFLLFLLFCNKFVLCENSFLYFAYGSNLLAKRILINNPTAKFVGIGKLQDYRLDFIEYASTWKGAVATIVEDPGEVVWGAIWSLNVANMASLDRQEGVDIGWYYPKTVRVHMSHENIVHARTYEQTINPKKLNKGEILPLARQPSRTYHQVIVIGAIECGLPLNYIQYLERIANNGRFASDEMRQILGQPF